MAKKLSVTKSVTFDFSDAGASITIPAKPADGLSADKRDAAQKARNEAYLMRAGMQLDAFEGVIRAHAGDPDTLVRAFYTWCAQCTKANYSLSDAARDSGKADVQTRDDAKLDTVKRALSGMSKADLAALIASLSK